MERSQIPFYIQVTNGNGHILFSHSEGVNKLDFISQGLLHAMQITAAKSTIHTYFTVLDEGIHISRLFDWKESQIVLNLFISFAEVINPDEVGLYYAELLNLLYLSLANLLGCLQLHEDENAIKSTKVYSCLLYTSPSPRDRQKSRMPSSA
eukprot:TRINITY_DN5501_c0_g1_i2.p1 TRINITY_DN5501_c0_g1~~TRINITY_DN5501_c0_g1_i2.p1  ORF type:complete len:151 (-),score=17.24 TRINITY_DN5501_c0_g1_i2:16-468(-)